MGHDSLAELHDRLRRLEDESAITRLIMSYGPAADAGLTAFAGQLWLDDGEYDWDANGEPHQGGAGVDAMLQSDGHQSLIARGQWRTSPDPLLIDLDGDQATALNYSLIMQQRRWTASILWRASAVRWDLERTGSAWRVSRRTNRLLDETGVGRELFGATLTELFGARHEMSAGRLAGKVAIITGASTGLGPVMAKLFVREGARVLLSGAPRGTRPASRRGGRRRRHRHARRRDQRRRRHRDGRRGRSTSSATSTSCATTPRHREPTCGSGSRRSRTGTPRSPSMSPRRCSARGRS